MPAGMWFPGSFFLGATYSYWHTIEGDRGRFPSEVEIFLFSIFQTGCGSHPASYQLGSLDVSWGLSGRSVKLPVIRVVVMNESCTSTDPAAALTWRLIQHSCSNFCRFLICSISEICVVLLVVIRWFPLVWIVTVCTDFAVLFVLDGSSVVGRPTARAFAVFYVGLDHRPGGTPFYILILNHSYIHNLNDGTGVQK